MKKYLKILFILLILVGIPVIAATTTNNFTIKKVDQNDNPIKDVEFQIYGKPMVKYETTGTGTTFTINRVYKTNSSTFFNVVTYNPDLVIYDSSNNEVKRISTTFGTNKTFNITLEPGTYTIKEVAPNDSNITGTITNEHDYVFYTIDGTTINVTNDSITVETFNISTYDLYPLSNGIELNTFPNTSDYGYPLNTYTNGDKTITLTTVIFDNNSGTQVM